MVQAKNCEAFLSSNDTWKGPQFHSHDSTGPSGFATWLSTPLYQHELLQSESLAGFSEKNAQKRRWLNFKKDLDLPWVQRTGLSSDLASARWCCVQLSPARCPRGQDGTRESLDFAVGPSWGPDIDISLLVYLHTTVQRKLQENPSMHVVVARTAWKEKPCNIMCVSLCCGGWTKVSVENYIFNVSVANDPGGYTSYCQWSVCVCVCAIHVKNMWCKQEGLQTSLLWWRELKKPFLNHSSIKTFLILWSQNVLGSPFPPLCFLACWLPCPYLNLSWQKCLLKSGWSWSICRVFTHYFPSLSFIILSYPFLSFIILYYPFLSFIILYYPLWLSFLASSCSLHWCSAQSDAFSRRLFKSTKRMLLERSDWKRCVFLPLPHFGYCTATRAFRIPSCRTGSNLATLVLLGGARTR